MTRCVYYQGVTGVLPCGEPVVEGSLYCNGHHVIRFQETWAAVEALLAEQRELSQNRHVVWPPKLATPTLSTPTESE